LNAPPDPIWGTRRQARWEAYFTAAAEEEKREAERLYQWMMHEREKEELKAKLHRFYHERVDQHTWEGWVGLGGGWMWRWLGKC
jgi:hypothetical protein